QHQGQHEEHEQVQIRHEAVITAMMRAVLMRHVTDGIDVDQRTDAGNDKQHDRGEAVHHKVTVDVEGAALNPGEIVLRVRRVQIAERHHRFQHPGEREYDAADGEDIHQALGKAPAEQAVDHESGEREDGYEPELHLVFHRIDIVNIQ